MGGKCSKFLTIKQAEEDEEEEKGFNCCLEICNLQYFKTNNYNSGTLIAF